MIKTNTYIHDNFILTDNRARTLYHEVAKHLPIIDFHNHLNPSEIANNSNADNIATLWVVTDQYKHRAMRLNGIPENEITGNASDYNKFLNWAKTLPKTIGNPLHQWSYLELKRIFDIDTELNENSAAEIWAHCNDKVVSDALSSVSLLKKFNVEALCTSDDLLDDVSIHKKASNTGISVLPSLRTDSIINQSEQFRPWCDILEELTQMRIKDLNSYQVAINKRFDVFNDAGCRLADQALDAGFGFSWIDKVKADTIFKQLLSGERLSDAESMSLKSVLIVMIGKACADRNWALQLHIGAQRKTSTRLKNLVGGAGGYAAVGSSTDITTLTELFDTMDKFNQLPRIILYNLNPTDNAALASLTGSFSEDGVTGKIQFGPAWWYNDHQDGIISQLKAQSNYGLLHNAIGMTTDSRSFLSMSRHEYYRRILCQWVSNCVSKGLMPDDTDVLSELIRAICYKNPKNWILKNNS